MYCKDEKQANNACSGRVGTRRVVSSFVSAASFSRFDGESRPTHPSLTQAVGRRVEYREFCLKVVLLGSSEQRTPRNGRGVCFLMVLSWARPHLLRMVSRVT
ncbi:MAG: hypothetical protein QM730_04115 [Anaerolineales bacterium]